MSSLQNHPDAAELIEKYLSSGGSESAFADLIAQLSPLVYSSALRRTGDPHLAEDVSQNVFAILVRRAPTLRKHPSVIAWIYQTTRYQAAKAMRTERRRRRKLEALAQETSAWHENALTPDDEAAWKDALPVLDESLDRLNATDRRLVLERFFEQRPYAEIAARTGSTEAACKMRLKRALGKMSGFLRTRGVTLSLTGLACGLTSELARAAPATLTAIAPNSLAVSATISSTSLFTNTLYTMSQIKIISLTSAAVFALASVPFFWQQAESTRRFGTLADLKAQHTALKTEGRLNSLFVPVFDRNDPPNARPSTIGDLLNASSRVLPAEELTDAMMKVWMNNDMMGMIRLVLPIARLDRQEYEALLDDVRNTAGNDQAKAAVLQVLGDFAPSSNYRASLDRMLGLGTQPPYNYSDIISEWASEDPDAAYEWYQEKLEAGELFGKGVYDSPDQVLLSELIGGMAKQDTERALSLFADLENEDTRSQTVAHLGGNLAAELNQSGDSSQFDRFMEMLDAGERKNAISSAMSVWGVNGSLDDGFGLAERYLSDAAARRSAIVTMLVSASKLPFGERADWLLARTTSEEGVTAIAEFMSHHLSWHDPVQIEQWLESQPSGEMRDVAFQSLVLNSISRRDFDDALVYAQRMEAPSAQSDALISLGQLWLKENAEEARKRLPAEVIENLHTPDQD